MNAAPLKIRGVAVRCDFGDCPELATAVLIPIFDGRTYEARPVCSACERSMALGYQAAAGLGVIRATYLAPLSLSTDPETGRRSVRAQFVAPRWPGDLLGVVDIPAGWIGDSWPEWAAPLAADLAAV